MLSAAAYLNLPSLILVIRVHLGESVGLVTISCCRPNGNSKATPESKSASPATAAATEDDDQANSLNELAVMLADTHSLITLSIQKLKEREATRSPRSTGTGSSPTKSSPTHSQEQSYESVFKELQFGRWLLMP